jgi:hypothetical protein
LRTGLTISRPRGKYKIRDFETFAIINFGSPLIGRAVSGFTHERSPIFLGRERRDRFGKGLE